MRINHPDYKVKQMIEKYKKRSRFWNKYIKKEVNIFAIESFTERGTAHFSKAT